VSAKRPNYRALCEAAMNVLRQIAEGKRKTRDQRVAWAAVMFLETQKARRERRKEKTA
jgi:hypothetical protein